MLSNRNASSLIRTLERRKAPKVGMRVFPVTYRDIVHRNAFKNMAKVLCPTLKVSYDIPIHEAIVDFLIIFKRVLVSLNEELKASREKDLNALKMVPNEDPYKRDDINKLVAFKTVLQKKVQGVLKECLCFLSPGFPWFKCRRRNVTTVSIQDVPDVESYKALYFLMLQYFRKRNFRGCLQGNFYVPRFVRNHNEEILSVWQRNYSYVYEVWVFKRLVEAFIDEGFRELRVNYMKQIVRRIKDIDLGKTENDPLRARREDGLEVALYHGLIGYKDTEMNREGFSSSKICRLTPDFVIVFTNPLNPNDKYWMVLDAKSGEELDCRAVEQRGKYKEKFKLDRQSPHQSWLVYSGRLDGSAAIEFNADEARRDNNVSWCPELEKKDPLWGNGEMSFTVERGIVGYGRNIRDSPVGHLRVNVNTVKTNDVFAGFVKGQVATVESWFRDLNVSS